MYSNYYMDAVSVLNAAFSVNNMFSISSFHTPLFNQGIVESCLIEPLSTEDSDRANLKMSLQFKEYVQDETGGFVQASRTINFVILNPEGDRHWTRRMKLYVWDGNYPDTVAIDRDTGEVYLLYLGTDTAEFKHYSELGLDKLEAALSSLNYNAPYYIFISDKAMFEYIDGGEGYNHLLRNTYIMLDGSDKVRIDFRGEPLEEERLNALSNLEACF